MQWQSTPRGQAKPRNGALGAFSRKDLVPQAYGEGSTDDSFDIESDITIMPGRKARPIKYFDVLCLPEE